MRIYWLNGGLYVEPEGHAERDALGVIADSLKLVQVDQQVQAGPISLVNTSHEKAVVGINEGRQVVPESARVDALSASHGPI